MTQRRNGSALLRLLLSLLIIAMSSTHIVAQDAPARHFDTIETGVFAQASDIIGPCTHAPWEIFLPLVIGGQNNSVPFRVSVADCRTLVQGFSGSTEVALSLPGGMGTAQLSLQGAPAGLGTSFSSSTLNASGNVTLTLNVAASVPHGTYPLTVKAQAGNQTANGKLEVHIVEPLVVQGNLAFDTGGAVAGAPVTVRTENGQAQAQTISNGSGAYSVKLPALEVPAKVLVSASFAQPNLPTVANSRWQWVENRGLVPFDTIRLSNPVGAQMPVANGSAQTDNGALAVSGLPNGVAKVYGRNYDPDYHREVFPGDFTEEGDVPLNSSGFLWMEAVNASGDPVDIFVPGVTIRSRLPRAQWGDLVDITHGTDRIEIPIYSYDEAAQIWVQDSIGWLENEDGAIVPEDAQEVILDGSLAGQLFAVFDAAKVLSADTYASRNPDSVAASRSTRKNVDYPHVGPWNLSDMDPDDRNNECTKNGLAAANTILHSQKGRDAYKKVNQPDYDFDDEFAPGKGPKVLAVPPSKFRDLPQNRSNAATVAVYPGDSYGPDDELWLNKDLLWKNCGPGATDRQKQISTMWIAATVLHETSHWKDDHYKYPGKGDTPGEEGNQLEADLFGGVFNYHLGEDEGQINNQTVSLDQIKEWLDPKNWPAPPPPPQPIIIDAVEASEPRAVEASPLQITLALTKTTFAMGEEIPVKVTFTNISNAPIRVLKAALLEGWPLYFNLVHQATNQRADFVGPEISPSILNDSFVTLQPNQTFQQTFNLLHDPSTSAPLYAPFRSGTYKLSAVYESIWGMPQTGSNQLTLSVLPGGSLSGQVANAYNSQPVSGTNVVVFASDGNGIANAFTSASGNYSLDLPNGVYTITARTRSYVSASQANVVVNLGQNTVVNFSKTPLNTQYPISVGQVISDGVPGAGAGRLEVPNTRDYYTFEATAGQQVFVDLQALDAPLGVVVGWDLEDDDGNTVFDTCLGCGDPGVYTLTRGGTYMLTVDNKGTWRTGAYRFQIWNVPPANQFAISVGDVVSPTVPGPGAGLIESPGAMDIYTFNAAPGQQVFFDLQASATSAGYVHWRVNDAHGTKLFDQCLGCGNIGTKTLSLGGTYTLTVGNSKNDDFGAYRFQLLNVPLPDQFNISIGQVITTGVPGPGAGAIESPGALDIYTFNASVGQKISFDLQAVAPSATSAPRRLVDSNGSVIFNTCLVCSSGTYTLTLGGTYTLTIGSATNKYLGTYQFRLLAQP